VESELRCTNLYKTASIIKEILITSISVILTRNVKPVSLFGCHNRSSHHHCLSLHPIGYSVFWNLPFVIVFIFVSVSCARCGSRRKMYSGNSCWYSVRKLFSSRLISRMLKIRMYKKSLPVVLHGC
jgi:hypothetical protein